MAGSIWGEVFRVSTWGESHGEGVGVVVDGAPAGISLSEEDIQKCLDRRKPGETKYSTPRKEGDKVKSCPVYLKERQPERRFPWLS